MGGVSTDKMTIYPTDEQLFAIIDAKSEHVKTCPGRTWYDLSHYEMTVRCSCGWELRTETTEQGDNE